MRVIFLFYIVLVSSLLLANTDDTKKVSPFAEDNAKCFKCHGNASYTFYNKVALKEVKKTMWSKLRVDSVEFYNSNHWSFGCTDCHSPDFENYPHPSEARMEENWSCMDCHGYDESFAQFHFEDIDGEFQKSVHYNANEDNFTCWKCHNPHTYEINARKSRDIQSIVMYDNNMCLNCHANFDNYQLLTDHEQIDIIENHDWLPNQKAHFQNVRCIECHAKTNDSILVAHLILPKDSAVRLCAECHSKDSRLMTTLYKFQSKENRSKYGILNQSIINKSFVIGANRIVILNKISLIIFIITLLFISTHTAFRIIYKRKED